MGKIRVVLIIISASVFIFASSASAEEYGGIEFPNGELSFADEVITYDPLYSGGPASTSNTNPQEALGVPDDNYFVSLGRGGLIELKFVDNFLINDGTQEPDMHIFEIGPDVEDTFVAVRPTQETAALLAGEDYDSNDDGFYEIGKVSGSTSSIDIDAFFAGYSAGELLFDAVQLIDDYNEGNNSGATVGADIDAVGAIGSVRSCDYALQGDINMDCKVDLSDLAIMAKNWLINCKQDPSNPACEPLSSD
ncbi:hypothetical protein L21SP3_00243 [Sedimentisphaera cyanobacteriorum]|uniref:Dockerin domain-containing protein n=1 Tax=Sedimentisphaera cyanobacteriorum TaxID=1940790 RepID=A0A1Q2HMM2_9BACT|nr:hypothetical protein [Sedimentisphaera cyanobacteriorum]AQQ08466.1 hypothetical protein L21SP3_00243 [Sedimentisphaera cyanobacteriorum]